MKRVALEDGNETAGPTPTEPVVSRQDAPVEAGGFTLAGVGALAHRRLATRPGDIPVVGSGSEPYPPAHTALDPGHTGDHILNPQMGQSLGARALRDAAVLIPVRERAGETRVLFTRRTNHLPTHAGQIAFPGGKVDPGDADATDAALREAEEEIGLAREFVTPLGALAPYLTGSGFRIMPILALVAEGHSLRPEPGEVAEIFDVPLSFLMSPANHQKRSREWEGRRRHFYAIPYDDYYIWGVTAGIVRSLYDTLYR